MKFKLYKIKLRKQLTFLIRPEEVIIKYNIRLLIKNNNYLYLRE